MCLYKYYNNRGHSSTRFIEWGVLLCFLAFNQPATAQEVCDRELERARAAYQLADQGTALALIFRCLERRDITGANKVKAYELQALTYLISGDREQAKESIRELRAHDPDYKPDPRERPEYIRLVEEVWHERELPAIASFPVEQAATALVPDQLKPFEFDSDINTEPPGRRGKIWLWIGLGAVTAGGGFLGLSLGRVGSQSGQERLPDPPGDPGKN